MSMDSNIRMSFTREALLERLHSLRPAMVKQDAANKTAHSKEEREFLAKFKRSLKEAAAWNYEKAKQMRFSPEFRSYEQPKCPYSLTDSLDRQIGLVERSANKRFVINPTGVYHRLYELLTEGVKKDREVC
jgi:hypothetical protein